MNDSTIKPLVIFAMLVHIVVGIVVGTRRSDRPLLPLLNLLVALCILGYWIPRWYSYVARSITWYATDQLVPVYALLVCVLCGLALTGRLRTPPSPLIACSAVGGAPRWQPR